MARLDIGPGFSFQVLQVKTKTKQLNKNKNQPSVSSMACYLSEEGWFAN